MTDPRNPLPVDRSGPLGDAMANYLLTLDTRRATAADRSVSVIAGAPSSAVIALLLAHADDFSRRRIALSVQLAQLYPAPELGLLIRLVQRLNAGSLMTAHLRHLRDPKLWDAHEQMVLGVAAVWSGDALRRAAGQRAGVATITREPGDIRLATAAFRRLWERTYPLPAAALRGCAGSPAGQANAAAPHPPYGAPAFLADGVAPGGRRH